MGPGAKVLLKAFAPAAVPFSLLHVDTGHNFPEVLEYRDRVVAAHGLRLHVASVQDYIDRGVLKERPDGVRNPLQTLPLTEKIQSEKFDAVFGGGRRDEDKARRADDKLSEAAMEDRKREGYFWPRACAPRRLGERQDRRPRQQGRWFRRASRCSGWGRSGHPSGR